jgi:hypothetical protein
VLANLLATFRLNRWLWHGRRAAAAPLAGVRVGDALKVAGVIAAIDGEPLVSPFTRMPCVAWMARVEEKSNTVVRGGMAYEVEEAYFREQHFHIMCAPFWIDVDGGGRLRVDDGPTNISLFMANVNDHPHVNDENPAFAAFMRSAGIPPTLHMGIAGEHRFTEAFLRAGERISVYGTVASTQVMVAGGYRGVSEEQLSLRGDEAKPLVVARA